MKLLKLIIASILFIAIVVTIISLFIPSDVRVSKTIQINASEQAVVTQISNPGNWRNWYPGADSSKFYYENGVIKGLLLNEAKGQSIVLTGKKDDEVTAAYVLPNKKIPTGWEWIPATDSNSVTVQWYIDFHLRWYPWEKFTSFMFEKVYNPQLKQGLENLKQLLEKKS
jgi:hypothetical protein